MDVTKLTNTELSRLMKEHYQKANNAPELITQQDVDDAWALAYEAIQRNSAKSDEYDMRISEMEEMMNDFIIDDITYRAAYKFIFDKGLEKEFETYLMTGIDEVASKVIPFPKVN